MGLTSAEAESRLKASGLNKFGPSQFDVRLEEAKKILLDPMGLMLLTLAALYALLGQRSDALVLLMAYIPVTAVDVILGIRAHKAIRALQATFLPTAKVIRDGQTKDISTQCIVVGDVIVFEEGQALPADGKIIETAGLSINEAALTGESVPIEKTEGQQFFAGTLILQGRGLGLVEAIGQQSRFGKIANLLTETQAAESPLLKKVNFLVRRVTIAAVILAIFLFVLQYLRSQALVSSIMSALTFGISAIPEEFPLVFTLYLSLGAWRLSRHGVLVKSLPSVETLGGVTVICTDKTGTLTEGKFQLEDPIAIRSELSKQFIWQITLMACEEKPVDAMEMAVYQKSSSDLKSLDGWKLIYDYPFESSGKHMSHVWRSTSGEESILAMKGAVEGVLEHCRLQDGELAAIEDLTQQLAGQGKRLLGLAYRQGEMSGQRELDERDLVFLGLLVFSDPLRSSVKQAIASCQKNGITIKMLTGDHPLTAHAIADEAGIRHSHEFLFTGKELAEMDEPQRQQAYHSGAIFSRVLPEQKYELVKVLKDSGHVVAMTGDGINDAPALRLADIGISMGANATDVARSTAQMILLKNDFQGIVAAVLEGRNVFSNLRRSFSYLIAFHIPVIILAFLPVLLGWGDLLLPIHIILLELIVHPISAFAFENLPADIQSVEKSLLPIRRFIKSVLAGLALSLFCLVVFRMTLQNSSIEESRRAALLVMYIGNMFFVLNETWPLVNKRIIIIFIFLLFTMAILFYIPAVSNFFHL